jgi:hypothetical protein
VRLLPFTIPLGLVPPLTYVDVSDGRLAVRFGPWFALEASLDAIESADEARGELPAAPSVGVASAAGFNRLQLRTAKGPLVRIRFREPQAGRWLVGPPVLAPGFARLNIGPKASVDEIAVNVADPRGLLRALGHAAA